MDELWECESCKSVVHRDQIVAPCGVCKKRTCIRCQRVCDKCLQIYCMFHMKVKAVMIQETPKDLKLCQWCFG
jgi:hypothetical protein